MQAEDTIDKQLEYDAAKMHLSGKICAPCFKEYNIRVGNMQVTGALGRRGATLERLERQAAVQTTTLGLDALTSRFYVKRAKTS